MDKNTISVAELRNLVFTLRQQLDENIIVVGEDDIRHIVDIGWMNNPNDDKTLVRLTIDETTILSTQKTTVKHYIDITTKEELITFFNDIRMVKFERWTIIH